MAEKELIHYQTKTGKEPFHDWLKNRKDKITQARIERRLERLSSGNYGDFKSVGKGVIELRLFFGAGYRVYCAEDGDTLILLLHGGDKSSKSQQNKDIQTAQSYLEDYLESKAEQEQEDKQ